MHLYDSLTFEAQQIPNGCHSQLTLGNRNVRTTFNCAGVELKLGVVENELHLLSISHIFNMTDHSYSFINLHHVQADPAESHQFYKV